MLMRIGAAALILGCVTQINDAKAAQQLPWIVYGPSDVSCERFMVAPAAERESLEWWLLGFVSGAGYARAERGTQTRETDWDGIKATAEKHCREHPEQGFDQAAIAVVKELADSPLRVELHGSPGSPREVSKAIARDR